MTMDKGPEIGIRDLGVTIDVSVIRRVSEMISESALEIGQEFFDFLMSRPESARLLSQALIETYLKPSVTGWLQALLALRSQDDLDRFIALQKEMGLRHARISLPIAEMQVGMSLIRRTICNRLARGFADCRELARAVTAVDSLVDLSIISLSQIYVADVVADARSSQALNLQATGIDMALQTEGLRASLFDWHRQILSLLIAKESNRDRFPAIRRTNFGLWVLHKGDLMFPGSTEVRLLERIVRAIDERFDSLFTASGEVEESVYRRLIEDIEEEVTAATAILSAMTDRTLAMEGGRDALTKLFNRRFLRTVIQREIRLSQSSGDRFGVLLLDVDHFKLINDTFGHETGDRVLKQLAEVLLASVRAGDFVFRYGGEEFLLLVGGMTTEILVMIAEKVRQAVQGHLFRDPQGQALTVTVSIGLALHDGHPDYQRLIAVADDALYEAKRSGRNRHVLRGGDMPPVRIEDQTRWQPLADGVGPF
jgi:diguanylate cyclase